MRTLVRGAACSGRWRHRKPSAQTSLSLISSIRSSRPIRVPGSSDGHQSATRRGEGEPWRSAVPHTWTRRGPNDRDMQRLSGLDASFLYLETAAQPLHVCSILEIDTSTIPGGYTFDRLRDALTLRIKAMPEFREKLADNRLQPRSPGVGGGQGLRRRPAPAPHRPAVARRARRARRDLRTHRVADAGPQQAAVGDVGHRERRGHRRARRWPARGADQGAPRRRRRRHRRQPDVAAVHHRGRRARRRTRSTASGGGSDLEIAVSGAIKFATRPLKLVNVLPSTLSTVRGHREAGPQRTAHGGAVRRAQDRASTPRSPGAATSRSPSSTSRTSRPSRTTSASRSTTS